MSQTLEERLRSVLAHMADEDVHVVAAFAEFLSQKRHACDANYDRQLSEDEHARIVAALDGVASLSMQQGPPVSNRDHDKQLYGGD